MHAEADDEIGPSDDHLSLPEAMPGVEMLWAGIFG